MFFAVRASLFREGTLFSVRVLCTMPPFVFVQTCAIKFLFAIRALSSRLKCGLKVSLPTMIAAAAMPMRVFLRSFTVHLLFPVLSRQT